MLHDLSPIAPEKYPRYECRRCGRLFELRDAAMAGTLKALDDCGEPITPLPLPPPPVLAKPIAVDDEDLAVCRGGCPDYQRNAIGERCWLGLQRANCGGCERDAAQQWLDRWADPAGSKRSLCPRQTEVRQTRMISPARQGRIQIEITNFCGGHPHAAKCSNCSRFCPHVAKPFFMDLPAFRRAVDSMDGYSGLVGIMGGEPTLHPQFAELVGYYRDHWGKGVIQTKGRQPIRDFADYHASHWATPVGQRCGLWSSLGPGYRKHYELIQDTFGYQCINTHDNKAVHQILLATRKELGVHDTHWIKLRNACWVQRYWSASINPRGAWFCEMAAALAMLYGDLSDCHGPRQGWPVEPGWWKRTPSDFGEQLQWCEICAAPLATPSRLATEDIQDVSPWHLERLKRVGSPAIRAGRSQIFGLGALGFGLGPSGRSPKTDNWYMPQEDEPRRAGGRDELLRPKRIDGVVVSVDCGDQLAKTLPANAKHFDRLVVVTATHDTRSQRVARDCGTDLVVTDACYDGGDAFNKGRMLNAGLSTLDPRLSDWLLFHDADVFLPPTLGSDLRGLILNPGCLYYTRRHHLPHDVREPDWALVTDYDLLDPAGNHNPWGYFQLVNVRAQAIRSRFSTLDSRLFPDCFCSAGSIDNWLAVQWPHDKRVSLADWAGNRRFDVLHLWHGPFGERWNGARGHAAGWRFAGQSDVATQDRWQSLWPVPCLLRRIHIRTCDQETIEYRGGSPQWRRTSDPSAVYEYSVRSPTQ